MTGMYTHGPCGHCQRRRWLMEFEHDTRQVQWLCEQCWTLAHDQEIQRALLDETVVLDLRELQYGHTFRH